MSNDLHPGWREWGGPEFHEFQGMLTVRGTCIEAARAVLLPAPDDAVTSPRPIAKALHPSLNAAELRFTPDGPPKRAGTSEF